MNRNPNMNRQPNGSMMSPQMNPAMRNSMPPNMQQQALRQMQQQSMSMRNTMPPQNQMNRNMNPNMNPNMRGPNNMGNQMNPNMNPNMNRNNGMQQPGKQGNNALQQPGGPKHRKDKTKIFGQDPSVPAPPGPGGAMPGASPQMARNNSQGRQPQMGNRNSNGPKISINGPPKNNRVHADSVDSMNNTADDDIYGNYSQRNTIAGKPGPQLNKAQSFQPGMMNRSMG